MSITTISKSKKAIGIHYSNVNGERIPTGRRFMKMVVEIFPSGRKKKNGKPAMISKTRHVPDGIF